MELVDQPKPPFDLTELAAKLDLIYNALLAKNQSGQLDPDTKTAREVTQELIAIIDKHQRDIMAIEPKLMSAPDSVSKTIATSIGEEKIQFHVCGVQLIEHGKIVGTSLYTTIIKARKIRDILNSKFAEMRVNHEAKILNYPVF